MQNDLAEANQKYETLARANSRYATLVNRRREFRKLQANNVQDTWKSFVVALTDRLENSYAYFSALCLKDPAQAFAYARKLFQADPEDAQIQDTLGFVTMRFAENISQLDEAERLFVLAMRNPNTDPETPRLASAHLRELHRYRDSLENREQLSLTASVHAWGGA